jgi:putative ABC transport system permease protein
MLPSHLKLSLRHLWRQRFFTALNVLGLAVGISACWIIWRITSYELSFDAQQPDKERIYRVVSRFEFDGKESGNAGAPRPMAQAIAEEVAGVERTVPHSQRYIQELAVPAADGAKPARFEKIKNVVATSAHYFELVPYRFLAGDPSTVFAEPDRVVLTQRRAEKYFPNLRPEQVVGKTLLYHDTLAKQVSAVVADLDYATNFTGQEFWSVASLKWKNDARTWGGVNSNDQVLIQLAPEADPQQVERQINELSARNSAEMMKDRSMRRWHVLQPVSDWHYNAEYASDARLAHKPTLYGLLLVAGFLLLLACINFVNLATAQAPQRAREIGVRKTMGGTRAQLIGQFLRETMLVTVIAAALSYGLVHLFFASFKTFVPDDIPVVDHPCPTLLFLAGLCAAIGLLAGLYPGWVIARFQPASILRGQPVLNLGGGRRITLRKGLIVFQFVVAQVFIIGALIVGQQLRYGLEKDLGYDKEAVVLMDVPIKVLLADADNGRRFTLKQELGRLPGVQSISLGEPPASASYSSNTFKFDGPQGRRELNIYHKRVDTEMIPLYRMELLAGRNLAPSDTAVEYVVNETCVREMGLNSPEEAIGQLLTENQGRGLPIVGVVRDFHLVSLHQKINPVAMLADKQGPSTFNIKLASTRPADWESTLRQLETTWNAVYAGHPFEYQFFDESLLSFYEAERRTSRIINLATLVAVLISCLGLFGLVTLTAWQRTKEIGIRKVLGASVAGITGLLTKDFLVLVVLATVISSPIAYWAMSKWLRDFAYRVDMHWWIFALAGLAAVGVAFLTVSFQSVKAALANPVESLRSE